MSKTPMRKISRKGLVKKCDKLLSQLVIKRDKRCVICGSTQQLGAGHVLSRKHYSLRWDLSNVFCQCWPCNFKHVHDTVPYFTWYIKSFGQEDFDNLYERWNQISKLSQNDLQELSEYLEDALKNIQD